MKKAATPVIEFSGFTDSTFRFLERLENNNNKIWFEEHKQDFETDLLGPLKVLVAALTPGMKQIDAGFETRPVVNKTISTIYRDVRFSKDKSPLKTVMWIVFKRAVKDWKERPAYYFEISKNRAVWGMGFYSTSKEVMSRLRNDIQAHPDIYKKALKKLPAGFEMKGEHYKKPVLSLEESLKDFETLKNIYFVKEISDIKQLKTQNFAKEMLNDFDQLKDWYDLFSKAAVKYS
jgi:uncharacterized protein (TIGR02453 family)